MVSSGMTTKQPFTHHDLARALGEGWTFENATFSGPTGERISVELRPCRKYGNSYGRVAMKGPWGCRPVTVASAAKAADVVRRWVVEDAQRCAARAFNHEQSRISEESRELTVEGLKRLLSLRHTFGQFFAVKEGIALLLGGSSVCVTVTRGGHVMVSWSGTVDEMIGALRERASD